MDNLSKEEIELEVKNRLNEALESFNDDGSVISVEYDEKTETCMVKFPIILTQEKTPDGGTWTNLTFNGY